MIVINCKGFFRITNDNLIYCVNNDYVTSIEEINNGLNDILIKEILPKNITYYNLKVQIHNPIGPAYYNFYNNGNIQSIEYCINDKIHRSDGPAKISYSKNGQILEKLYFLNGKAHNTKEAAYQRFYPDGSIESKTYWVNGKHYSIKNFEKAVNDYNTL